MKKVVFALAIGLCPFALAAQVYSGQATGRERKNLANAVASVSPQSLLFPQRWEDQARNVTIVRDDWGIAHVHGKTDADAVFGMIYAQAEDDFNRVETNFINSQGRLAEAEGISEVYRDLRMKLYINPDSMKAK